MQQLSEHQRVALQLLCNSPECMTPLLHGMCRRAANAAAAPAPAAGLKQTLPLRPSICSDGSATECTPAPGCAGRTKPRRCHGAGARAAASSPGHGRRLVSEQPRRQRRVQSPHCKQDGEIRPERQS